MCVSLVWLLASWFALILVFCFCCCGKYGCGGFFYLGRGRCLFDSLFVCGDGEVERDICVCVCASVCVRACVCVVAVVVLLF